MGRKCRKKPSKAEVISDDSRISSLSDELLCRILSFIPSTKEVVATTILSKRWHNVWTCVDNLHFDNLSKDKLARKMQFAEFVHKVFKLHKAPCINKMSLYCHDRGCNEHDIATWLTTAISRSVESLDVFLDVKFHLPFFHFDSQTLVNLKIDLEFDVEIQSPPYLPSLKTLHLETHFPSCNFVHTFISGCSALESLHLQPDEYLNFVIPTTLQISSATLQKIYLGGKHEYYKLALDTPALTSLCVRGANIREYVVESDLSYVSDAVIRAVWQNSDRLASFIQSLSSTKVLQLHLFNKRPMIKLDAQFCNLTSLKIRSTFLEPNLLKSLMENSNNLQDICLEKVGDLVRHEIGWIEPQDDFVKYEIGWVEPQEVPTCLTVSLKKMTIKGIERLDELDMVEYVLSNGKVLEMMEIHSSSDIKKDYQLKFEMLQRITTLEISSEIVVPAFY